MRIPFNILLFIFSDDDLKTKIFPVCILLEQLHNIPRKNLNIGCFPCLFVRIFLLNEGNEQEITIEWKRMVLEKQKLLNIKIHINNDSWEFGAFTQMQFMFYHILKVSDFKFFPQSS